MLEKLYEAIEYAVINNKPVKFFDEDTEKLQLKMLPGQRLLITNLYWTDQNRNIYNPILEAQYRAEHNIAQLYVTGNMELNNTTSGRTWMFVKENRYKRNKNINGNEEIKFEEFKYKPEDFPYPLNEDIEKVYKAYREKDMDYLELYVGNIYLTLKHAGINRVLSDVKVHEMQQYFWSILDSLKDKNK